MARCALCRKSELICRCYEPAGTPKRRRGKANTTDARGYVWCGACSCRVINDKCTNIACSTRK